MEHNPPMPFRIRWTERHGKKMDLWRSTVHDCLYLLAGIKQIADVTQAGLLVGGTYQNNSRWKYWLNL